MDLTRAKEEWTGGDLGVAGVATVSLQRVSI